jgi:hypothetical protein
LVLAGPSTRASGSTTTTESSRASAKAAATRWVRKRRASASPLPRAVASHGAPLAAVWPPWSVGRSLPPEHNPAQVRGRRSPAGLHTTSAALPASRPTRAVDRAAGDGPDHMNSPRSSRDGCPGRTDVSPSPPPAEGDEMDAIGRTDGHQTAGRRTGWHQTAGQPDPDEGARQPDTGRAGHRTAGHLDPGRIGIG